MSYEPLDGEVYAQRHHANLRRADVEDPSHTHPLLSIHSEVTPLPSSRDMSKLFDRICGKRHPGHSRNNPDKCYLYYAGKCDPAGYGPRIPRTMDLPFDKTVLPGKAPVLEHLYHLLSTQDSMISGGSFLTSLTDTIDLCRSHRQVSESSHPQVHTLIFGRSSESEVTAFLNSFNSKLMEQQRPKLGSLPHALYSFDVESVSSLAGVPYHIQHTKRGITTTRGISSREKLPARVHLGFHDERFDIVFPWEFINMADDFRAEWTLTVPSDPLPDFWHKLFGKLQGYAIGIGIHDDVSQLDSFLSMCYKFKNAPGPLRIHTLDLEVLLALAGYNSPKTSITALNFFFTGGIIQKKWEIRCGMGRWASTVALPTSLNLYLQSEAIGVLNVALVALMCILVHWFVTPGIAAIVSRKCPLKFISWFWRFMHSVLLDARLPSGSEFSCCGDRIASPSKLVSMIVYGSRRTPVFSPTDLSKCIPPWRNITGGGCAVDQYALDHIIMNILPMLRKPGVPLHLKWESSPLIISRLLTGRCPPAASIKTSCETGCNPDPATIKLPLLIPEKSTSFPTATVRRLYINYRSELDDSDPIKNLTSSQLLLLSAWRYPREFSKLLAKNGNSGQKHFTKEDFFLLDPLLSAFDGDSRPIYSSFAMKCYLRRKLDADTKRAEFLNRKLALSTLAAEKRNIRGKIRSIANKWLTRAHCLGGDLPRSMFIPDSLPTTSRPREHLVQTAPSLASSTLRLHSGDTDTDPQLELSVDGPEETPEITEIRTVRFASPPPDNMDGDDSSSTTDHELLVDTLDWEDL